MHQNYLKAHPWSIIEKGFDSDRIKSSESIFSLGNGAMGQRANFEERYSGPTFRGSYIAGVYYPDKTRVGWWKNGYPEYFAKVLNAPNWIGIDVEIDGEQLDLFTCKKVKDFCRELNMKEGWYKRNFIAVLQNDVEINVEVCRFLSLKYDEVGAVKYSVTPLSGAAEIIFTPYVDGGISNEDSNWDDVFWDIQSCGFEGEMGYVQSKTNKTNFQVCTAMITQVLLDGTKVDIPAEKHEATTTVSQCYTIHVDQGETLSLEKYAGYTTCFHHDQTKLVQASKNGLDKAVLLGFEELLLIQKKSWYDIWETSDISIEGDIKAQQGIRFNIFQLNQTYLGKDPRLNIGPKGFTGEKYGGSTYWDTEAYCIPFYLATKSQVVAENLLTYRHNHLSRAIENAEKLGFNSGAALFPMVTMNGEECHNEWEITFEEIHRNGAIAFAIHNFIRYTADWNYVMEKGIDVLIGIARFWAQRATFSPQKNQYVILGVTGPNEYENNINNNWYTNYLAKWCLEFTAKTLVEIAKKDEAAHQRATDRAGLSQNELSHWEQITKNMYFPYDEKSQVYLQQDGFLDKEYHKTVDQLNPSERPINQKWSWDRILRSPYIKQADVLQGFYFFEDHFTHEELERHFDFYEPLTVHESSLSPCVHSILAAKLGRMDQAYDFYLRTSRLDLDDYNKEVHEGLHITSMAGTWMSIVEGFAGMRVQNDTLAFNPQIPKDWTSYSFKVNFRGTIITVQVNQSSVKVKTDCESKLIVLINGDQLTVSNKEPKTIQL